MTIFDDPNRQALGLDPIWTGAGEEGGGGVFDPGDHTVAEVQDYIAANPDDADRVIEAEASGKARVGILGE